MMIVGECACIMKRTKPPNKQTLEVSLYIHFFYSGRHQLTKHEQRYLEWNEGNKPMHYPLILIRVIPALTRFSSVEVRCRKCYVRKRSILIRMMEHVPPSNEPREEFPI